MRALIAELIVFEMGYQFNNMQERQLVQFVTEYPSLYTHHIITL